MILRTSLDEDATSGDAHDMQNEASAGFSFPQFEQLSTGDAIPRAHAEHGVPVCVSGPESASQTAQGYLRDLWGGDDVFSSEREAQVKGLRSKQYELETPRKRELTKPAGQRSDEMNGFP